MPPVAATMVRCMVALPSGCFARNCGYPATRPAWAASASWRWAPSICVPYNMETVTRSLENIHYEFRITSGCRHPEAAAPADERDQGIPARIEHAVVAPQPPGGCATGDARRRPRLLGRAQPLRTAEPGWPGAAGRTAPRHDDGCARSA